MRSSAPLKTCTLGISVAFEFSLYSSVHSKTALELVGKKFPLMSVEHFVDGTAYLFGKGLENSTFEENFLFVKNLVERFFTRYDGLIIPGNNHNINASINWGRIFQYDEVTTPKTLPNYLREPATRRTFLEIALVLEALKRGVPVLGVCNGLQVINVALGGELIDVMDLIGKIKGKSDKVTYFANTQLHTIIQDLNSEKIKKNYPLNYFEFSSHSQAIEPSTLPKILKVNAENNREIIKAIEIKGHHPWLIGTQFHPEDSLGNSESSNRPEQNVALFKNFIQTCQEVKTQRQKKNLLLKELNHLPALKPYHPRAESKFLQKLNAHLDRDFTHKNNFKLKKYVKSLSTLIHLLGKIHPSSRYTVAEIFISYIKNSSDLNSITKQLGSGDGLKFLTNHNDLCMAVIQDMDGLLDILEGLPPIKRLKLLRNFKNIIVPDKLFFKLYLEEIREILANEKLSYLLNMYSLLEKIALSNNHLAFLCLLTYFKHSSFQHEDMIKIAINVLKKGRVENFKLIRSSFFAKTNVLENIELFREKSQSLRCMRM